MIHFTKPKDVDIKEKPRAFAGQDYPLEKLTPRNFEKLIYHLYDNELNSNKNASDYSDVMLMGGVKDGGRDCVLITEKTISAIIQCKHSENNTKYKKNQIVTEVLKYILYGVQQNKFNLNENNLKYILVVSSDFNSDCEGLRINFNEEIKNIKIEKYVTTLKNQNATLRDINYAVIKEKLWAILNNLKFDTIIGTDIQEKLFKSYNESTVNRFFELRSSISKEVNFSDTLERKIIQKIKVSTVETTDDLIQNFKNASFSLKRYCNVFGNISSSHIQREEVVTILDWIKTPLQVDEVRIKLLVGQGGIGKTVILKDILEKLVEDQIPTLGIKADSCYANSIRSLQTKLNLTQNIFDSVKLLAAKFNIAVVLIDQLDALSLSASSKSDYLNTFTLLINGLLNIENVRVVASIRKFDLDHDPSFQTFQNSKYVEVGYLKEKQIEEVLGKLKVKHSAISPKLKNLLKIPNNLNIFCKIFNSNIKIEPIISEYDLYTEFWSQKILNVNKPGITTSKVALLLFKIAGDMDNQHTVVSKVARYIDSYSKEIHYLSSENIIDIHGNQLTFFHQSFYDYVFARHFVESGRSLIDFIITSHNDLAIRSSVKMILSFVSSRDDVQYVKIIEEIIFSSKIYFHLKLLVINLIGFEVTISSELKKFVKNKIIPNLIYKTIFIESVNSEEWLKWLIKEGILSTLLMHNNNVEINLCYQVIRRFLPSYRMEVLDFLRNLPQFENANDFKFRILYFIKIWDSPLAYETFENNLTKEIEGTFQYYTILEDAAKYDVGWVWGIFKKHLLQSRNKSDTNRSHSNNQHHINTIFDQLYKTDKLKSFWESYEYVSGLISSTKYPKKNGAYYSDAYFSIFDYESGEKEYGEKYIYYLMIDCLETIAAEDTIQFRKIYKTIFPTQSYSILRLLALGLMKNVEVFSNEIFDFINGYNTVEGFENYYRDLEYEIRQLITKTYKYFNTTQKRAIKTAILSINPKSETEPYIANGKKILPGQYYGYTKLLYLQSIPQEEIEKDKSLNKSFGELKRKFPKPIRDNPPNQIRISGIHTPIDDKAYAHMSFQSWIDTFNKYNDNYKADVLSSTGGIEQHSRRFCEEVSKRPGHFLRFIEKIIESEISYTYKVQGVLGLIKGKYSPKKTLFIYKKIIRQNLDRFNLIQLIWQSSYFIDAKLVDIELLNFLCYNSINHVDPEKDKGDPLQYGANTIRGAAVSKIVFINFQPKYKNKIFSTLMKVAEDKSVSVKVSLIANLRVLARLDKVATLKVFLKLVNEKNENILKHSIATGQSLSHFYFSKLIPYFNSIKKYKALQSDLAIVLAVEWLKGKKHSKKMLDEVLRLSDKAKANMVNVALKNIITKSGTVDKKCVQLYLMNLNVAKKEIIETYETSFLHLNAKDFELLLPLLRAYTFSKISKVKVHYFYDYLLKCLKNYPRECLELMANLRPNIKETNYLERGQSQKVKVIIGIYNSLLENFPDEFDMIDKALRLFDTMLQDQTYRLTAREIIRDYD